MLIPLIVAVFDPGQLLEELSLARLEDLASRLPLGQLATPSSSEALIMSAVKDVVSVNLSGLAISKISSINTRMNKMNFSLLHNTAELQILNFILWNWLEQQALESEVLAGLCQRLADTPQGTKITLDAGDFFEGVSKSQFLSTFCRPVRVNYTPTRLDFRHMAVPVLADWFGMPPKSQEKAWFVQAILQSPLGLTGMRLAPIVRATDSLSLQLFGTRSKHIQRAQVDRWASESLLLHPICNVRSDLHTKAKKIAAHFDGLRCFDADLIGRVNAALERLKAVAPAVPAPIPIPDIREYDKLIALLKALFPLTDASYQPPVGHPLTSLECLQVHVYNNSDMLLPFRDSAKSRMRILLPGGPYSQEHVWTKEGFFSALVYRGITHNTEFLQNNKTLFSSWEDYQSSCKQEVKKRGLKDLKAPYLCNLKAYGVPITSRKVENAEEYWRFAAEDSQITEWLASGRPINPVALYNRILTQCRGYGPLTTLNIVYDYIACGCAKDLTLEEMADLVVKVDRGGIKGMQRLGYDVNTGDRRKQVVVTLRSLKSAMVQSFTEAERNKMGFGLSMIEHSMCKFCRMDIEVFKNWYANK